MVIATEPVKTPSWWFERAWALLHGINMHRFLRSNDILQGLCLWTSSEATKGAIRGKKKRFQHLLEVSVGPFLQRWVLPLWSY